MRIPEAIMNELRQCEWSVGGGGTDSPRWIALSAPYIGNVITYNHCYGWRKGGGSYLKPEARDWRDALAWLIIFQHIEDYRTPIKVTISGEFKDKRSTPDLQNLKLVPDAIQEATGMNDRDYKIETEPPSLTADKPMIFILIEEANHAKD